MESRPVARTFRGLQAVLLVARGRSVSEVARVTDLKPWAIYAWVRRYLSEHRPEALADRPRSGRPRVVPGITDARIVRQFRRDPLRLGYNTTGWTVALLAAHLSRTHNGRITPDTLRRRMRALGLRWKRPRYVYADKDTPGPEKRGSSAGSSGYRATPSC
ncbi:transposase : Transposase OS=Microvirga lotononidis GN=MicloDRAFT_00026950 PE=4 SV=1: HTH_29 [Gemmata massiliana]|uniref:Winged helix-turn helix domain-containing protein n=1 Tax=Gemmata massiliana TaxID=1210884 RepID=A0A6P2D7H9_9BACT|nr:helix-turn-helix domain-containing protein [Gemmata massiliana]VTR96446.1 transposase : Transposase OS=Microvirga lotononidis GN=MicloDRAFT_00026950 PE=4 SV=1: HTH_29 [Gemmata massiliana]